MESTGTKIAYVKGEGIFSSGDIGRHLFIVLKGAIELRTDDGATEIVGAGGIFGERAVMETVHRTHHATALAESTLLAVDQSQFLAIVAATLRPQFDAVLIGRSAVSPPFLTALEALGRIPACRRCYAAGDFFVSVGDVIAWVGQSSSQRKHVAVCGYATCALFVCGSRRRTSTGHDVVQMLQPSQNGVDRHAVGHCRRRSPGDAVVLGCIVLRWRGQVSRQPAARHVQREPFQARLLRRELLSGIAARLAALVGLVGRQPAARAAHGQAGIDFMLPVALARLRARPISSATPRR